MNDSSFSRRTFLTGVGAGVASTLLPWRPVNAQGANTVGNGAHTYEVISDWAKLPEGKQFGFTHGVQVDRQGRVFIHNQSKDAVAIFDADGKFIKSWGPEFAGGAHGMQLSREGNDEFLYLADYARHIVVKSTLDGETVWTLKWPEQTGLYQNEGQYRPTNVAIAANGDFYVADGYGLGYIHQYNNKAEYVRSWGGKGSEPGKFQCPHGLWIDTRKANPQLIVTDRESMRVQAFALDGTSQGVVATGLRRPCHFDQRGELMLVPELQGRVTILGADNQPLAHLGDNPDVWKQKGWPNLAKETWTPGKFISPHGACFDAQGNIYVVEWVKIGRVTKLRKVA